MKNGQKGFALVEVVIVIVLISGSFLVFLEALSQAKSMQVKSEILTIQSMLLSSKINQLRANGFDNLPQSHDYLSFTDYPNYSYSVTCSYINYQIQPSSGYTDYKLIELKVKHNNDNYLIISDYFIITSGL
jgi:prepilin-type N-terminal cleavage/methylation domain-containing protein